MRHFLQLLLFAATLAAASCQIFGRDKDKGKGPLGLGPLKPPDLHEVAANAVHLVQKTVEDTVETIAKFAELFADFKTKFRKKYSSPEEEKKRLGIFADNFKRMTSFTKVANLPYKLKINALGDFSKEEFNKLNGLKVTDDDLKFKWKRDASGSVANDNVDWREKGAVMPVRYQGFCGSCYAFASAAALEALFFNQTGKLEYLSPQNLIDCSKSSKGNFGCNGGIPDKAFQFVTKNGIYTEDSYPYEETDASSCQKKPVKSSGILKGYTRVKNVPGELEKAVRTRGPVVIGMDGNAESFQFYSEGVYYDAGCSKSTINHAVLLIGYGTEPNGDKYWLIKNSYGESWGIEGYGKIARNESNHCGVGIYAAYPH